MHAWSKLVQDYLDENGVRPAELARQAGLTRQVIGSIVNDTRDRIDTRPDQATIDGLARAMGYRPERLLAAVAQAMGLPVTVSVAPADTITNAELLRVLSQRLEEAEKVMGNAEHPAPMRKAWTTSVTESRTPSELPRE